MTDASKRETVKPIVPSQYVMDRVPSIRRAAIEFTYEEMGDLRLSYEAATKLARSAEIVAGDAQELGDHPRVDNAILVRRFWNIYRTTIAGGLT